MRVREVHALVKQLDYHGLVKLATQYKLKPVGRTDAELRAAVTEHLCSQVKRGRPFDHSSENRQKLVRKKTTEAGIPSVLVSQDRSEEGYTLTVRTKTKIPNKACEEIQSLVTHALWQ